MSEFNTRFWRPLKSRNTDSHNRIRKCNYYDWCKSQNTESHRTRE